MKANITTNNLLFSYVGGSRLLNLSKATSDLDIICVWKSKIEKREKGFINGIKYHTINYTYDNFFSSWIGLISLYFLNKDYILFDKDNILNNLINNSIYHSRDFLTAVFIKSYFEYFKKILDAELGKHGIKIFYFFYLMYSILKEEKLNKELLFLIKNSTQSDIWKNPKKYATAWSKMLEIENYIKESLLNNGYDYEQELKKFLNK